MVHCREEKIMLKKFKLFNINIYNNIFNSTKYYYIYYVVEDVNAIVIIVDFISKFNNSNNLKS